MWPSWVFGSSGFPSDRLPQLTLPSQKGNQWAPIGWGLPGLFWGFNGFNYSENGKLRLAGVSHFLDIFGTSEMFTKAGPFHPLFITKRL